MRNHGATYRYLVGEAVDDGDETAVVDEGAGQLNFSDNSNMKQEKDQAVTTTEDIWNFPLRRLYFVLIVILTIISLISISVQTNDISSSLWGFTAEIKVGSLTPILLFFAWLPFLLPWIIRLSPRFRDFLSGLREDGVEEIELGIFRIKLEAGVKQATLTMLH